MQSSEESTIHFEQQNHYGRTSSEESHSHSSALQSPIYEKILQKPDRIPRHSLRISPELFEPHLLLDPPPTAVELLQKIRELIAIAKSRLRNFKFRPSLVVIPEDDYFYTENISDFVYSQEDIISLNNERTSQSDSHHINSHSNSKFQEQSISNTKSTDFVLISDPNQESLKSFSRREMLNNLKLSNSEQTINDLNYENKNNVISEKLIEIQNLGIKSEPMDEQHLYSDIQTLESMSEKLDKELHKRFDKQILTDRQVNQSNDKRVFSYFKNSLGRFGGKAKQKSNEVLISPNNWTLQTVGSVRNFRSKNMTSKSVIRKRMSSRRGQFYNNCSDVSSFSCHRMSDSYNDFEQKPSLESNSNNESMDSFDCCTYSDSEMSTTSSTIRDNQLTSLESELNDDSNHWRNVQKRYTEEENSPIDECLKYLAAASVDSTAKNHDRYYQRIGRASKGMLDSRQLKSNDWNHVCHRSDSELEVSQKKIDSKTNFYSKNSKSRIKCSKSLNNSNRQKFKKKLALYKSHTNVFNRTDGQNWSEDNCCPQIQSLNDSLKDNCLYNVEIDSYPKSMNNSIVNSFQSNDDFVIKIRI